ncbi:mitoguardin 2-like [Acanthaster planci]|uniref:Mitoguardin 2-like n=1 Tax=Acanthaster planci TaxID=133434 RepID=A0A8B7XWQ7_ACAPL|nr:mitoguardin 2-like [Acanthaster planci]XP_022085308.1 mitoguardin 2-like [Acanthaster planci]XP_022085309.1 mitoguardin 2-like [Acanthaster planci]XP_022085310.1 mitoguardin 2-like [Acanthaster planci]XP_022085311.1 mitoguardin 2-like [Acanthaster planci]
MLLSTKTKVILLAGISAMAGLILATSYFKRRRRGKKQRIRKPQSVPLSNQHVTINTNGPLGQTSRRALITPQIESPKGFARLSRLSRSTSRRSVISAIASRASHSSINDSLHGSVNSLLSDAASIKSGERTPTNESVSVQRLFQLGMQAFDNAVSYWEDAVDIRVVQDIEEEDSREENDVESSKSELTRSLEKLLSSAYHLQEECEDVALSIPNLAFTPSEMRDIAEEITSMRRQREADEHSTSSTESFVSATELEELEQQSTSSEATSASSSKPRLRNEMYENALLAVREGAVECRRIRTKMLHCRSDEDFLAKLHCVRVAMAVLLEDQTISDWFVTMGKQLISDLLLKANYDSEEFGDAYDEMMTYVRDPQNHKDIEKELRARKVRFLSFYDIVLDFLLLDAFDDLDDPPMSVTCVTQNRWLSNRVKESAVSTAVWSVLAAKRRMLQNPQGFLSKVYQISYYVTPALAWGFLGSDHHLKHMMEFFKDQVLGFARDMFSLRKCRYSTVAQLADDILLLAKHYSTVASEKLGT